MPVSKPRGKKKSEVAILRWEDPRTKESYAVRVPKTVKLPKTPVVSTKLGENPLNGESTVSIISPQAIRIAPPTEPRRFSRITVGFLVTEHGRTFIYEPKDGEPEHLIAKILPGFLKDIQRKH